MKAVSNTKTSKTSLKASLLRASSALLLALALFSLSTVARAEYPVRIPGSEFNFGHVPQSSTVAHTYWIYSNSPDTLTIDTVVSSCGCTSIPLENKILPPGDSLPMTMRFRSHSLQGPVAKRPWFRIKGDTTKFQLKFYANVVMNPDELYPLASYPPILDFTVRSNQVQDTKPIALKNAADEAIALRIADYPEGLILINVPDSLQAGEIFEGLVSLAPGTLGRPFIGSITFEVNGSSLYRLTIPISSEGDTRNQAPAETPSGKK